MIPGQVQKFTLDGKLLGQFGTAGRKLGQFGWIHALACVSENEILDGRAAQLARAKVRASSRTDDEVDVGALTEPLTR